MRCKQLLEARKLAYITLFQLQQFEEKVAEVKEDVNEYLDLNEDKDNKLQIKIKKNVMEHITKLTKSIIEQIVVLRDDYKIFSKMRAKTQKGTEVLNVMVYKRRDAMRYIIREYEAIKRLVQVADVYNLPVFSPL